MTARCGAETASGKPCNNPADSCPHHNRGEPSPFSGIRHPKKRAYLRAIVEAGGNVTRACEIAGIDRSTPYTDQWKDEPFQHALRMAKDMAADHLEAEAIRRAYEGVEEPVGFYQGAPSAYVQKYSDTLLIFLLKGAKPNKYVDRHQHSGEIKTSGVLMVPAGVSIEDWEREARAGQDGADESGDG